MDGKRFLGIVLLLLFEAANFVLTSIGLKDLVWPVARPWVWAISLVFCAVDLLPIGGRLFKRPITTQWYLLFVWFCFAAGNGFYQWWGLVEITRADIPSIAASLTFTVVMLVVRVVALWGVVGD